MLRPVRTVSVTTKEELDEALATADQITVEGDDRLLSYAATKAAGDAGNRIDIEIPPPVTASAPTLLTRKRSRQRRFALALLPLVLFLAIGVYGLRWVAERYAQQQQLLLKNQQQVSIVEELLKTLREIASRPPLSAEERDRQRQLLGRTQEVTKGIAGLPTEHPEASLQAAQQQLQKELDELRQQQQRLQQQSLADLPASSRLQLQGLAWPSVAIVAIVALFLIAWRAISRGSNVMIAWKVTEKVSGRMVITKVRERAPRHRAAA